MATQTFVPIASTLTTSDASSVTVSNIPQTYTNLFITVKTYSTFTGDNGTRLQLRLNSDTSSSYSYSSVEGNGGTVYNEYGSDTYMWAGRNNNNFGGNTNKSLTLVNINGYSATNMFKGILTKWSAPQNGRQVGMLTGTYRSLSGVTSVTFFTDSNMAAGTEIIVYGIL